jgi:transcriptional regulator with XRE-family HTH domain
MSVTRLRRQALPKAQWYGKNDQTRWGQLRAEHQLTLQGVADAAGCSRATLWRVELGLRDPDPNLATRLSLLYGLWARLAQARSAEETSGDA